MIDLAIALALERAGFGTYGDTIFWNVSPVLQTGSVSDSYGIWVNATTVSSVADTYTDEITISTRYADELQQGITLMHLIDWVNGTRINECKLSLDPLIPDCEFQIVQQFKSTAIDLEAVDSEGRWVKTVRFQIQYKYPRVLPALR